MGDHQHGQALLGQRAHDREHLPHHLRVQGGGGLVKEEDLRVHGQGPGDGHPLLLAAGELPGPGVDVGGHAHLVQVLHGQVLGLLLVLLQDLGLAHHAIFQHGHVVEEVEGLEHHPHPGAVGGGAPLLGENVLPMEEDLPAGGDLQQVDAPQQGGLAGARGPNDGGHVPGLHRKVDVLEHLVLAEGLGQVVYLQNHLIHYWSPPSEFRSPPWGRRVSAIWPSQAAASRSAWRRSSSRSMLFWASGLRSSKGVPRSGLL